MVNFLSRWAFVSFPIRLLLHEVREKRKLTWRKQARSLYRAYMITLGFSF
jgi:hypothetical protein